VFTKRVPFRFEIGDLFLGRKIKRSPRTAAHILSPQIECFQLNGAGSVTSAVTAYSSKDPFNLEVRITIIIVLVIININNNSHKTKM